MNRRLGYDGKGEGNNGREKRWGVRRKKYEGKKNRVKRLRKWKQEGMSSGIIYEKIQRKNKGMED